MTDTTPMVEKVARSLAMAEIGAFEKRDGDDGFRQWIGRKYGSEEAYVEAVWPDFVDRARAAIEALRVPTEEMVQSVGSEIDVSEYARRAIWTEMLNLSLGEPIAANLPDPRIR